MNSGFRMLVLFLVASLLIPFTTAGVQAYATEVQPGLDKEIEIRWSVNTAPPAPFTMWFTGAGGCNVSEGSWMSFIVKEMEDEIGGELLLGNITVLANNTPIAKDLVLGVWGSTTEWWPGLVIRTGEANILLLNQTAYSSAERVAGNYLNGTMISYYANVTAAGIEHQCIVFEYEQDPSLFGNQETYLAYSLETGILIRGSTSVNTGEQYILEIEYAGITIWRDYGILDIAPIIVILAVLVGIAIYIQKRIKKPVRERT